MKSKNARDTRERDRRRFLKEGVALAGVAALGGIRSASGQTPGSGTPAVRSTDSHGDLSSHADYGVRSRFETAARPVFRAGNWLRDAPNYPMSTPLQDQIGVITPSGLHFRNNHGYATPDIDPRQHRLLIHGLVDRPLIFTVEELKLLPSVTRVHFVECQGNSAPGWTRTASSGGKIPETVGDVHGRAACSEWTGVPVSVLLKEVGVQAGGRWVDAEGADASWPEHSMPLDKAMDDALVVYGQNGEAVRPEQGYPLRLLVPGFEGSRNIKWLKRLKVVDQPQMGRWPTTMYTSGGRPDGKTRWFNFELGPKAVITFPPIGQRLPRRGLYEIVGLAWSGGGAIRRVEISTDGGRTWKDARLDEPVHRKAFTRFHLPWNWDGQDVVLLARSTDELGGVQPTVAEYSKNVGVNMDSLLSGWHHHFNAIYPVKVTGDGSVHNGLFS